MANIKSAKKRILVNRTKMERNKSIKSGVKTAIKKVETAVAAKDAETAKAALVNATSVIEKAATKGVYHKNNASRNECGGSYGSAKGAQQLTFMYSCAAIKRHVRFTGDLL